MSNRERMSRSGFKHVETEIKHFHQTRNEISRLRNDIMFGVGGDDENVGGGRSNLPGDPTGRKATAIVAHRRMRHMEDVTEAIETVINRLPDEKRRFVRAYYWANPQTLTWDGIAQHLHVSRRTAINWRDEIVQDIGEMIGWM